MAEPQASPQPRHSNKSAFAGWILAILIGMSFAFYYWKTSRGETDFVTPYQAVLLSNGAVYYGKVHGYGTPHPLMTDVFYIVSQTNAETKQVSNLLVKRGKELHAPDRMYLTPDQILFVEPVGADSKVAQLISEAAR